MTSGPPPPQPLPDPEPPKPTISQYFISTGFVLISNVNEFRKSWTDCGTNGVCKMEKLILLIMIVFGISKPLLLLSDQLENAVNKLWMKLKGEILIRKNSEWSTTVQFFLVYSGLEQVLSNGWNWIRYSTDCLTKDTCEDDDILIWITNMKIQYCGNTIAYDDSELSLLECNADGQNCKNVEDDGASRNTGTAKTCITFFNKVPLLFAGIILSTIHFNFGRIFDYFNRPPPPPANGGGGGGAAGSQNNEVNDAANNSNNANAADGQAGQGQEPNGSGDSQNVQVQVGNSGSQNPNANTGPALGSMSLNNNSDGGNDPGTSGSGDGPSNTGAVIGSGEGQNSTTGASTENKGQQNSTNDGKCTGNQDKGKRKSPAKAKNKGRPAGQSGNPNNRLPTQFLDVSCLSCKRKYTACFPDPLSICCGACNPNDQPNSPPPSTSTEPPQPKADSDRDKTWSATPVVIRPGVTANTVTSDREHKTSPLFLVNPKHSPSSQNEKPTIEPKEELELSDLDSSDQELLELILSLEDERENEINHELNKTMNCQEKSQNHPDPNSTLQQI